MQRSGTPAAEVTIDERLVRALLVGQHPDLAGLPLRSVPGGWDNALLRLGDDLAVRLPRRALAAPLAEHEQQALAVVAGRLPLPVPLPVRLGVPGAGYPWRWSVVPWLAGRPADEATPDQHEAAVLGRFLRALHHPAPPDAPHNPYRSVPLAEREGGPAGALARLDGLAASVDAAVLEAARTTWHEAVAAPVDLPPSWIHGDLHPRNILVDDGRLSAVIDWGDAAAGDPATDLAGLWLLFAPEAHDAFWSTYGRVSSATVARARGWAVLLGAALAGLGDDPRHAATGRRALAHLARSPSA